MTNLSQQHLSLGAQLAGDGIPLHYDDQPAELQAALTGAVLLDRSHEGRILLGGRDRYDLPNRMSTNDLQGLDRDAGKPTIFTNPNARIMFRALALNLDAGLLLVSEAGQGAALLAYLQRNIFFGDQVTVSDRSADTAQFALHGPAADQVMARLRADLPALPLFGSAEVDAEGCRVIVARRKPLCGGHWLLMCPAQQAAATHQRLLALGSAYGLRPAGSLTYNSLRIRSGRPAGVELSPQFIPLEVGLWDEVSFSKGCYTGQEIIARMESRGRLAKTLVKLAPDAFVSAPAQVYADGGQSGTLTSSVQAADGQIYALAVLRTAHARPGATVQVGDARLGGARHRLCRRAAPLHPRRSSALVAAGRRLVKEERPPQLPILGLRHGSLEGD